MTNTPTPQRPIRVLFISAAGLVGGAERSLYELLCALPEERIEAHASVPPDGSLARLCTLAEVPVHPAPLRRFRRTRAPFLLFGQVRALYQTAQVLRKLVEDLSIDVLHANTDSAALVAWEVSRETGCPFVWQCRDLRPLGPLAKLLARSSACAVAISGAVEAHLLEQGVESRRIRRIENGIDLVRFHSPADRGAIRTRMRAHLGIAPDAPLLLDIGGWVPWKRHELFLEAFARVRRTHPAATAVLVGNDLFQQNVGYVNLLEARLLDLDLENSSLLVLQQCDEIPELLAAADLLVSPSDREPFGRVLAEAGAAGLAVVATNSGAKNEIVADGETGLLTPPGDAEALAAACLVLLDDPARMRVMGANARVRVAELFDITRVACELADLYEEIARRK